MKIARGDVVQLISRGSGPLMVVEYVTADEGIAHVAWNNGAGISREGFPPANLTLVFSSRWVLEWPPS